MRRAISPERALAWLQEQRDKLGMTTGTFNNWKRWIERRVYDGPIPDDVEGERREKVLAKMSETLNRIDDNTSWLSRTLANLWKYSGSEAEKKYPSRKK